MTRFRLRPRGVTGCIVLILCASVLLRGLSHVDMAVAQDGPAATPAPPADAVIDALRAREEQLAVREAALRDREQAISVAGAEIELQIAALGAAEESLSQMIAMAESAASDDLARLTTVYENMKPADAAQLFESMDPAFSAGFMALMRPDAAAAIMGGLNPATAYSISVILAGRNAETPTE